MKKTALLIILVAFVVDIGYSELSSCDAEHSTVCSYLNGTNTCCPVKEGTCCSDVNFCCPKGFRCDSANSRCVSDDLYIPYHLRTQILDKNFKLGKDILCPDNQTTCKETQTCCLFGDDDYGCCPLRHALCCDDKIHCCPKNYKCNPSQGKCDRLDSNSDEVFSIKWFKKQPGNKLKQGDNLCPDQKSQCPSGSTCCELDSGDWGCCPLPNAVCCEDHIHCCPNGYTCDVKAGRCLKGENSLPFFQKTKATKSNESLMETCADQSSQCPSGTTCCQLKSGEWGCCPLPNAVCCADHIHCCPNGYVCDVKAGRCNKGDLTIPFVQKIPSVKPDSNQVCPGGTAQCPSSTTCCQQKSGVWGCCPIPNAICCRDHEHCCPQGYTCDEEQGRCNKGEVSIPFLSKIKAVPLENQVNAKIVCPGGEAECPSGSTCCQLESGDWGCCPIQNAVCCQDHLHCCPHGYTCDIKDGRCNKGQESIPFYKKFLAKFHKNSKQKEIGKALPKGDYKFETNSVVCPDGCSFCPNGYTCCKMSDGSYGCCPLPNAVCCEDHLHCCPQNSHCNLKEKSCESNGKSIMSWLEKIPSKLIFNRNKPKPSNDPIVCGDNATTCDPLDTCCKMADGSYGCCPYSDGVCCTDLSFCCPGDSVCGNKIGECLKKEDAMKEIEALAPEIKEKFECDGTVCQNQAGQSICCPYKNGTCCGEHGLCCPNGYNCNSKDETCQMIDPDVAKPIKPAKKMDKDLHDSKSIQCNDTVHYCPDSSTCCKTQDSYGCCAIENAVCCDDGINCCPQGYICATNSTVTCEKKSINLIQLN